MLLPDEIQKEFDKAVSKSDPALSSFMKDYGSEDKDEHCHLVLLPGDVQPENRNEENKINASGEEQIPKREQFTFSKN